MSGIVLLVSQRPGLKPQGQERRPLNGAFKDKPASGGVAYSRIGFSLRRRRLIEKQLL